ncbi:Glucose-6-phosphate isomerase [Chthoniobacter flavus Ellin428]|uniref:Glucose-6-phosphate isomerase n=1 Tax=Chthoniobacter flavus Ellin428 TaxID=497964 RepID=B4CU91_9BACT|nr:glucose-6-phosphate isomerase [Chthoniobacter flavus]EDY22129.1 Glucose-6-phosphate isomerase [Chthoniobacter flavus Ellin428]TCO94838.1 glucose-6-phosphate isomerase [Chthoniobacter flavus]
MSSLWDRYQKYLLRNEKLGFSIDISRMRFGDDFLPKMEPLAQKAFASMKDLEAGAIANPDEKRMVGHYWLRAPQLAPQPELKAEIENCNKSIRDFVQQVYASGRFTDVLVIGIGGSALGPQFVADALGTDDDKLRLHFFDNTDPDGIDRTLTSLQHRLEHTLVVVISKSGGTPETRNGMLEAQAAYKKAGINFAKNAVAVTGADSTLDKVALKEGWLARFPMWDWVGGRTSVMSAVGLVPLWLQGLDMQSLLDGAAAMDEWTRTSETLQNPAMLLALMWHYAGNGRGAKDMVVLPYKDRLALYSKYLQQLVMESLGKALDLDGKEVHQGIAVYGNKGSTDQHAYVQQLRDGVHNFFVTFIEVRKDRAGQSIEVEPGVTSGDFLQGFLRGTRAALYEGGRDSLTISIPEVTPFQVGALIALYDRAVGFYATLVNINAYHQPGVEAGKKAAATVLKTLTRVRGSLSATAQTASQIATALSEDPEAVFHALNHLAANDSRVRKQSGGAPGSDTFLLA